MEEFQHLSLNEPDESSLKDRLINHLAQSDAIMKQQQRHEPDLTIKEKEEIAQEILESNPAQFLYRFGKFLQLEHLQFFFDKCGDPEIDFHLTEAQKFLNPHTNKIQLKNRRFAAMQNMKENSSYFSEEEIRRRNPLLYEQLVGQHLSVNEHSEPNKGSFKEVKDFATLLMHNIDLKHEKHTIMEQQEMECCAMEENESEDSEDSDSDMELENEEKDILKDELYSSIYNSFLSGEDDLNYSEIDESEPTVLLKMREQDEEERYFDESDS